MAPDLMWLAPSFFAVALVYSMAGFAGGSSYLALLAMSSLAPASIAPIALYCNVLVSLGGTYLFWKQGHIEKRHILPFLTAVPAAYFGARIHLSPKIFFCFLAVSLLIAGLRLLISDRVWASPESRMKLSMGTWGPVFGVLIGFWSGMVGVGGGIFLSPLLMLTGWAEPKKAAGVASVFILMNSVAGLAGRFPEALPATPLVLPLLIAVFLGGQLGSRMGSSSLSKISVQRVTALLILFVGFRLLGRVF